MIHCVFCSWEGDDDNRACPKCREYKGLTEGPLGFEDFEQPTMMEELIAMPRAVDDTHAVLSKKEVDLLVTHYQQESIRWDRKNGDGPLIDAAIDQLDYWLEVQRRFA